MEIMLKYQSPGRKVLYELRRMEESELRGGKTNNATNAFFSLKYEGQKDGMDIFTYLVSGHTQTNRSGLYAWVEDLLPLTAHLQLGVKDDRIEKVFNRKKICDLWERKIWYATRKKHKGEDNAEAMLENVDKTLRDDEIFANTLRYAPPFSLLFSGIHAEVFDRNKIEKRRGRLPGFAGEAYLPLLIEDAIVVSEKSGEGYEIKSEGKLDEKEFNRDIFRTFVRTLSDDPTAVCDLSTRHTERYLLDACGWVQTGMLLHLSVVPYFMLREERCFLKAVQS
ncbi:MAG: hypothetical protein LBV32_07160 [Tannerellaceae bacterium]|jgi:hypothetical protein|nr:hypothetical protein [Tannerellaceae bacterium]